MSDTDNGTPDASDSTGDGQEHSHEPVPLPAEAERIAELEKDLAEARDRLLRALAETENVRRRGDREREDTAKFAISRFAGDLLSVADNLGRALEAVPAQAREGSELMAKLVDGVTATERELLNVFEKNGLKRVEPLGEPFNANFHEVLFEVESADRPPGTVVQVFQPGYKIGERLLRPARVAVAKGGAKAAGVDTQA
jgi:molecular chaperone GrpE